MKQILALVMGLLWLSPSAYADKPFLRIEDFQPRRVLPGPPPSGSMGEKKDFETLLRKQSERTPAQCARANLERSVNMKVFFASPLGPFSQSEAACLSPLFDRLLAELRPFFGKAKDEWNRKRPYEVSSQVVPCVPLETSSSYPSGHAILATVVGLTLAHMYPERMTKIRLRVSEISDDRVLSGLHFPSDCTDGEKLGIHFFLQLSNNPRFLDFVRRFPCRH